MGCHLVGGGEGVRTPGGKRVSVLMLPPPRAMTWPNWPACSTSFSLFSSAAPAPAPAAGAATAAALEAAAAAAEALAARFWGMARTERAWTAKRMLVVNFMMGDVSWQAKQIFQERENSRWERSKKRLGPSLRVK